MLELRVGPGARTKCGGGKPKKNTEQSLDEKRNFLSVREDAFFINVAVGCRHDLWLQKLPAGKESNNTVRRTITNFFLQFQLVFFFNHKRSL